MNAPVWTRLHHIEEDFSGLGDIRIPVSLRLDALIVAFIVFGVDAAIIVNTGAAGTLSGGGMFAVIALFGLLFGIPVAVYRFLNSTHPDGRGRLRRLVHIAGTVARPDLYPTDRCGRHPTRGTRTSRAGHQRRSRR